MLLHELHTGPAPGYDCPALPVADDFDESILRLASHVAEDIRQEVTPQMLAEHPEIVKELQAYMKKIPSLRDVVTSMYDLPKAYFATGKMTDSIYASPDSKRSAAARLRDLGAMVWYTFARQDSLQNMPIKWRRKEKLRRKRKEHNKIMDIDVMVARWHAATVQLAIAHDKDDADRVEASIEECLSPILTAPVKQIREFARKLLDALKADPKVPFLVWRGYERYVETVIVLAPDGEIKELKTAAAIAIADMVEEDIKPQLHEALVRALQWRSPEKLEQVKEVVAKEKEKGNKPRLRGKESCLFMECGGTEESPEVCIQI